MRACLIIGGIVLLLSSNNPATAADSAQKYFTPQEQGWVWNFTMQTRRKATSIKCSVNVEYRYCSEERGALLDQIAVARATASFLIGLIDSVDTTNMNEAVVSMLTNQRAVLDLQLIAVMMRLTALSQKYQPRTAPVPEKMPTPEHSWDRLHFQAI